MACQLVKVRIAPFWKNSWCTTRCLFRRNDEAEPSIPPPPTHMNPWAYRWNMSVIQHGSVHWATSHAMSNQMVYKTAATTFHKTFLARSSDALTRTSIYNSNWTDLLIRCPIVPLGIYWSVWEVYTWTLTTEITYIWTWAIAHGLGS